jgi:hypothetical protein
LAGHFTAGTTVAKDIPIRSLFANVRRASSFIVAIVPLGQIRIDFNVRIRRNQGACPLGSKTRATEDADEFGATQALIELTRLFFAMFGQRNIGSTSVLVGDRPDGFAVTNEVKMKSHR